LFSGLSLVLGLNFFAVLVTRMKHGKWLPWVELTTEHLQKFSLPEKIGMGILMFLGVSALIQSVYWPIRFWDSLVLYDFRARLFAQTGFMQAAISQGYFFGYPLLTSLAHTWVYVLGGSNPSFIYSIFYIAFLISFFVNVEKMKLPRQAVIALTLLVAVSPRFFEHTQWAYANLPYSIYIISGSIYLYWGLKNRDFGQYTLSAVLIGLSTWARGAEPFWLSCVITAIVFCLFIKKWLWPLVYVGLFASIIIPWRYFQSIYDGGTINVVGQVVSTTSSVVQNLQFSVLKPTFDFFVANVFILYLIYFITLGVVIITKIFIKSREWLITLLIVFDIGMAFAGTLIFVKYIAYAQDIPDSLARMVMFIPVMICFLLAESIAEFSKYLKNEK
jgi:hypothetical protein